MVSLRRFGPLIGVVLAVLVVLLTRLFDVQVREHAIWAREAANLVRSWSVEPYRRGALLDRRGRPLVRDEDVYELDFVWRDFRRGHPLGQVAQLRSLLTMRNVSLQEARSALVEWAIDFANLSPAAVDAFGRGEAARVGAHFVPEVVGQGRAERRRRAKTERRGARASDLHFYVKSLLDPDRRTWRELERLRKTVPERSYLELVALAAEAEPQELRVRLETRLRESLEHLDRLAQLIDWSSYEGATPRAGGPLERLVALIEDKRRDVQFDTGDALFRRATGFDPARLDAANLARLDLDWLQRSLCWDHTRLDEWRADRGTAWPAAVERILAGHAIARAKLDGGGRGDGDRLLSALAYFFNGAEDRTVGRTAVPRPWWRVDDVVVLASLSSRLSGGRRLSEELRAPFLPFQAGSLRGARDAGDDALVAAALDGVPLPAPRDEGVSPSQAAAGEMLAIVSNGRPAWDGADERCFAAVLLEWDRRLQARVRELVDALLAGEPPGARAEVLPEWVDAALQDRAYVVRDRGARPLALDSSPDYELVYEVTRHPGRYAGFEVRSTTRRVPAAFLEHTAEPVPVAEALVGKVRPPYLLSLLEQRPLERALSEMQRKLLLPESDRPRILGAIEDTWQAGEAMGGSGLEGYFDRYLNGENGYRESTGLQDRKEGNREPIFVPPVDGDDLVLTLDVDLQRAAQRVIDAPDPPPDDEERPDRVWHANPVGAIVVVGVDGAVLVAASGPSRPAEPGPYQRDGQRAHAADRTLRQHTFQPPGSVLKPFVAAWALDRGWIDATGHLVHCEPRDGETLGTHKEGATVRCHQEWGHHDVRLHPALTKSCNAYFADVGERFFDGPAFREMARCFGFDQPTGVRSLDGAGVRVPGLAEDARSAGFMANELSVPNGPMLQRLGNGLAHVSVTPMQVARAYAGLATGRLPELRLVDRIGGEPAPSRSRVLPLSRASLETVRASLRDVPLTGTARGKGLDPDTLGFAVACKTGSADYGPGMVPADPRASLASTVWEEGVRKHGWVAGWFPAEDPVAVVVVYVHNTSTTASHVATHVLSQFLRTDEVRAWMEVAR